MTRTRPEAGEVEHGYPVAGLDRRFYGFVLDRLLWWTIYAVVAFVAYHFLIAPGHLWPGVAAMVGVVVVSWLATGLSVGLAGVTPAGSTIGLRIVADETGGPIGVPRALLRSLVVGVATLPFGFGTAALAVTAIADPSGRRRGWHDLRARSVVVDVRPEPVEIVVDEAPPTRVVNLTALRLVPASPNPPSHAPAPRIRAVATPLPPRLGPNAPSQPTASVSPRQGLGWPLVGTAPDEQTAAPATLGPMAPGARPTTAEVSATLTPTRPPAVQPSRPPTSSAPQDPQVPAEADETAAPSPAPSGSRDRPSEPSGPVAARPRWRVGFDTGEFFEVTGLTLVGRRPEPRPGEPVKRLVPLPSDDMSLSKSHAQFQVVPDGALVVMDRGSTNGSILIRAGVTKPLVGGRPQTLREGDRVRFGDREMTVSRVEA